MEVSFRSLAIAVTLSLLLIVCSGCGATQHPAASIPAGPSLVHPSGTNTIPAGPSVVHPNGTKHFAGVP
jgi:hypothetical protein